MDIVQQLQHGLEIMAFGFALAIIYILAITKDCPNCGHPMKFNTGWNRWECKHCNYKINKR